MQIDIKKDRELLGLPPKNKYSFPRFFKIIIGALAVLVISSGIGQLLGLQAGISQQIRVIHDFQYIINSSDTVQILPKLEEMRAKAAQGSSEDKLFYGFACYYAANIMPRYTAWLEEALLQLDSAIQSGIANSALLDAATIQHASILFELGREQEAFKELVGLNSNLTIDKLLSADPDDVRGGINFYNIYSYILATANDKSIQNGELALKLIKKVIIQPEGRESAYLDTLAEAYLSAGMIPEALNALQFALAKSSYSSLWSITEHYSKLPNTQ